MKTSRLLFGVIKNNYRDERRKGRRRRGDWKTPVAEKQRRMRNHAS